ncbi:probable peptidoglycan muropeptide transporter SLC46 [Drosophila virilis]|uniref:probable peptidoglycan muropeptide transporter SLC46 n=1 Tax=Drosophila virilis TaxID=7244 RepID=UPI0038B38A27
MKAFAFVDWQIYLAIGLGIFKSLVNPMCRTMITNLLPGEERGKVFAMLSVLQTLSPFASSTLYIIFYTLTLSSAPGLFQSDQRQFIWTRDYFAARCLAQESHASRTLRTHFQVISQP